jgi:ABC-2 type transport system permease protein
MPPFLQAVTTIVPAKYFLTALRGVVLKGVDATIVWPQLAALALFAAVLLMLASVRLRRQWA